MVSRSLDIGARTHNNERRYESVRSRPARVLTAEGMRRV